MQRVKFIVLKMLSFHSVLFHPGGVPKGIIGNPELRETSRVGGTCLRLACLPGEVDVLLVSSCYSS